MNRVFALLLGSGMLVILHAQGTWTQIMNQTGQTTEASATYYEFNASISSTVSPVTGEDIAYHSTLKLPLNGTTIDQTYVNDVSPCGGVSRPSQQMFKSNLGPSSGNYLGLAAQATFNYTASDVSGTSPAVAEQSVFFHERQCYDGGREYGVVLNGLDGVLYFYWSTLTNTNYQESQSVIPSPNSWTGTEYWFEIWPVYDGNETCHFVAQIVEANSPWTVEWGPTSTTVASNITGADGHFCSTIRSESGYVTADTKVSPTVTFASGAENSFTLALSAIDVGK